MELKFRTLRADEIDIRTQQVSGKGCSVLLYKDARCDMTLLDETVGPMNWKREHTRDNKNCIVSVWDDTKSQWVSKEDTGTESNAEAEKGLASDSFKRACVCWGIGRELYTAPRIWINAAYSNPKEVNGRWTTYERFYVSDIEYNEARVITYLTLENEKGQQVYAYGSKTGKAEKKAEKAEKPVVVNKAQREELFQKAKAKFGEDANAELKNMLAEHGYSSTQKLPVDVFHELLKAIGD